MRLSKIKLAGFKSFVDPAQVKLPSNLIGVVGPNGCGKSNIIDAVRWVLGESSAKHLRGAAMADVVFNGSTSRKPVGQASVELTFDNTDGRASGEFAKFNEIAVRREVTREGQSSYFLNGARCRRRDITDLFLGTGLGPRSYAIIEQGMISRIIDAKPEELRNYLEEAAGISKYKERRRETENRIRHSRENIERLNDLREEVDKQLQKLKRQSDTAERYKTLKAEERRKEAELLALKLRDLESEAQTRGKTVTEGETRLEAEVANQRRVERELEQHRQHQTEATDVLNEVQARFYEVGAEIAKLEQGIQHARDLRERQQQEYEAAEKAISELDDHFGMDNAELEDLKAYLEENQPLLQALEEEREAMVAARDDADAAMAEWQDRWESFNRRLADPTQAAQVQLSRADQLERQIRQHEERIERLNRERETLDPKDLIEEVALLEAEAEEMAAQEMTARESLEAVQEEIRSLREGNHTSAQELDAVLRESQTQAGRLASLNALQQAALGEDTESTRRWLEQSGLAGKSRLATRINVEKGWERAVETVLGGHLEAVCVDGLDPVTTHLDEFEKGSLILVESGDADTGAQGAERQWLRDLVSGPGVVSHLLADIAVADDLAQAMQQRAGLSANQSIITRDGIWIGKHWLRVWRDAEGHSGVLERQQEIETLSAQAEQLEERALELKERVNEGRERLQSLEQQRDQAQAEIDAHHRRAGDVHARLGGRQARLEQIQARLARIDDEVEETKAHREQDEESRVEARELRSEALEQMEVLSRERTRLEDEVDQLRESQMATKAAAREAREKAQSLALEVRAKSTARKALEQGLDRMQGQRSQLLERRDSLNLVLEHGDSPMDEQQSALEDQLIRRAEVDEELNAARRKLGEIDDAIRNLEQQRFGFEEAVQRARESLEKARMGLQEVQLKRRGVDEQLSESGFRYADLLDELPLEATAASWEVALKGLTDRIARLGPINLAAIDEYKEQKERKEYLDSQYEDLMEALETLETAIRKIDRETRTRFKETFDLVNGKLQELFPRMFGGGHAYLELTEEDLLNTGVTIMARPPGKKNQSIQLLSGGEKALTAAALVFAFFELNPAPFCMLDEVDAPLDDANVGRFCELVREMSDRVQFVFISHNKVTMEIAHELLGVTMQEPGVSRLVAVDVEEAARMAAL